MYKVSLKDGTQVEVAYNPDIDKFVVDAYEEIKPEVPLNFRRAIIMTETGFGANIVSKAGAVGIMQLMPATARELGLKVPDYPMLTCEIGGRLVKVPACSKCKEEWIKNCKSKFEDERFDAEKNIKAGIMYIKKLYEGKAKKDLTLTAAAYNGGPSCLSPAKKCPGKMVWEREEYKGYTETREYVKKVTKFYEAYEILENEGKLTVGVA